ncbi:jg10023 [Pararge aegeria aegeria]|uniref:Jg10023 protein n=1 Tax=Pararge aegeria aegeria TaxID=348720 RepID=A0A8S4SIH5_9NEOP|nr:jg10023 [Pararge aegeria aegeria]
MDTWKIYKKFNNAAMIGFILIELIRLFILSIIVTTLLLVLKQNIMDIGLVIGASVMGGFVLLGLFYLWVCAASLPLLINEMELEEQAAKIEKLQLLLENKNQRFNSKPLHSYDNEDLYTRQLFVITGNTKPDEESRMNRIFY